MVNDSKARVRLTKHVDRQMDLDEIVLSMDTAFRVSSTLTYVGFARKSPLKR